MKFGGATLGNGEQIRDAAGIIRQHAMENALVVVTSAMSGVTHALMEIAQQAALEDREGARGRLKELRWRHLEASGKKDAPGELTGLLEELEHVIDGVALLGELTPRSRDRIADYGERLACALLAAALEARAVKHRVLTAAEAGVITDAQFGAARPLEEPTLESIRAHLNPLVAEGLIPILPGLSASTLDGSLTTFGRGGSDITAALVGAAIGADEVWLWGNKDGLMTAEPQIVPEARLIREIAPAEAIEMGQFGSRAVHPRALEPAQAHNLLIRVRNAFKLDCEGTCISPDARPRGVVRAVHVIREVGMLTLSGSVMFGRPGTAALLFDVLARERINVLMISQSVSEAGISVALRRRDLQRAREAIERQLVQPGAARAITVDDSVAIVALVGGGMHGAPGVAGRIFGALAEQKASVNAIAQGSSELSISFAVREDRAEDVVRALHKEFDPT